MNSSRLAGLILDCNGDLEAATTFWSEALQLPIVDPDEHGRGRYALLGQCPGGLRIEVQKVEHESRVHLDLEVEKLEVEVARLQALGATIVSLHDGGWVVMQAPTGQRFCVIER